MTNIIDDFCHYSGQSTSTIKFVAYTGLGVTVNMKNIIINITCIKFTDNAGVTLAYLLSIDVLLKRNSTSSWRKCKIALRDGKLRILVWLEDVR